MADVPEQGPPPVLGGPPLIVRRAAFTLVLVLMAVSLPVSVLGTVRAGGYVLATALFTGAVARAVLPEYLCLGLLVRSRRQDALTLLALGVAVTVVAGVLPQPS